jgi:hypothetical protein
VGLEFKVANYESWGYRVEASKKDEPNAKRIKEAASAMEVAAPPGYKFDTVRYLFKWDKHDGFWVLKNFSEYGVSGNIISIEEFLEHKTMKALVENRDICDSIAYYDPNGNDLDEVTAFEWSKHMDPSSKPPSKRPGKRAQPEPEATAPATPAPAKQAKSNA